MTIPDTVKRYAGAQEAARERWNELHARVVGLGGGVYRGAMADLVLFDSPATRSTLALRVSELTPEAVRAHIAESNARFKVAL